MRLILEKAFYSLLNQEKEKANDLVHQFMLERARQIHESLRQGESDVFGESWDQDFSIDEMFTESDLVDELDDEELEGDEVVAGDEVEGEEEGGTVEDRLSDLESELQRLAGEFDAQFGDELDMDPAAGDEEIKEGDLTITQSDDGDLTLDHDANADEDEEFANLGESALSDLELVPAVSNKEGRFLRDGGAKINAVSPVARGAAREAAPVKIKSADHQGFEREAAPKTVDAPASKNTLKKSTQNHSKVSKEGDKSAALNDGTEDEDNLHSLFDRKLK